MRMRTTRTYLPGGTRRRSCGSELSLSVSRVSGLGPRLRSETAELSQTDVTRDRGPRRIKVTPIVGGVPGGHAHDARASVDTAGHTALHLIRHRSASRAPFRTHWSVVTAPRSLPSRPDLAMQPNSSGSAFPPTHGVLGGRKRLTRSERPAPAGAPRRALAGGTACSCSLWPPAPWPRARRAPWARRAAPSTRRPADGARRGSVSER